MPDSMTFALAERWFLVAFVAVALLWAFTSAYVVLDRVRHDRRRSRRERLQQELTAAAKDRPARIARLTRDALPPKRGTHPWRRIPALFALAEVKPPHLHDVLRTALFDGNVEVANAAATILHRLGDRVSAATLVAALRGAAIPASRVAMRLEQFPLPVDDLLRPLLADPRPETRYWAASLLSRYVGAEGLAAELIALADDPNPSVRKAALITLGTVGAGEAAPTARRRLTDDVPYVRAAAVRALGKHGLGVSERARRREVARWIAGVLADGDWNVRAAAKEALVLLGAPTWREVAAQLESSDAFARNGAAEVLQNLGVLDWMQRSLSSGSAQGEEVAIVLARALDAGGALMAEAVTRRTRTAA
jgi:HEAT repeat protein